MARMIPSVISPEVKSNAERHIFSWFRDDPSTKDWVVLHSLGIANHNKVIHGETDFFVLAPHKGLFALEVKGGRVSRKAGIWSFKNKYDQVTTKERGPFDQAWDGVFSIVADIKQKLDSAHRHLEGVFFGIGVMFPDIDYESVGCDEAQWQVFDKKDGRNVGNFIRRIYEGASNRWMETYGQEVPPEKLPSEEDVNYLANILRGDFDKVVANNVLIKYSEEALIKLTQEQYRCIDQLEDNKRCLIQGGAGTGKTLIAIEEAKRSASGGLKVGIFCYNKNLGEWLKNYFKNVPVSCRPVYVGTFHSYLVKQIKESGMQVALQEDNQDDDYYKVHIPSIGIRAIQCLQEKYDKIIIDEAQDLLSKEYLDAFNSLLYGGLERGSWTMFGDFSNQAIYQPEKTYSQMLELLEDYSSFVKFKLTINCRNTRNICEEIAAVTGLDASVKTLNNVEGMTVNYFTYKNEAEEKEKIVSELRKLLSDNIEEKNITFLSPYTKSNSVVSQITEFSIPEYRTEKNKNLSFCTAYSFKGLENSIIFLTDINSFEDKKLMYVALSRARVGLFIFLSEAANKEYLKLLIKRG